MANNVVGPWEVDAAVTGWFGFGATVLLNADDLARIGPKSFAAAADRHGFINGFASTRTAQGQKIRVNAVLRFADPASASAAAADLGDIAAKTGAGAQRAQIPGHPDAAATSYTHTEGSTGKQWTAVRAFTAHGAYVFLQLGQTVDGLTPAIGLVAKAIDLQGPIIDQFRATDPSKFADISLDPTGLLARTLPVAAKDATTIQNTTYEQRGALHFQNDPARSATLFSQIRNGSGGDGDDERLPDQGLRERGTNRGRVLRRVAADVTACQAGQQPVGQPLPATEGQ
jgi:hypothetical protein